MAESNVGAIVRHLRWLLSGDQNSDISDRQLVQKYLDQRDEAAFAGLVHRHGRLVMGVCRRVLHHTQDAEDVFQATFLILARKANSIRGRGAIGSWLYQTAYRLAQKARVRGQQQRDRESQVAAPTAALPNDDASWREVRGILDEELARLPDKYRAPILLCYFEGRTQEEAAGRLGWPVRTLQGRLVKARELLRRRLVRRGLPFGSTLVATVLSSNSALASVPAAVAQSTCQAAALITVGESITSTVSGGVATILEGALREMAIIKVSKFALAVVLLFSFVSTGVGIIVGQASSAPDNTGQVKEDSPLLAEKPEQGKKVEPEAVLQPVLVAGGDKLPLDQDAEKFMKDYLQSLKDLAVVLKTIKDSASAEAAVPKVEEAVKRLVAAEGKALRNNPTKDPVIGKKYNEVREKYASELQEVKTATYREIDRFYGAPELQKILLASTEWAKLDAVSEKNGISEKNWPTFVQGWRALKITDKDDAVTKLLKERYNAVQVELRGRYIMWMQDAESLGMVYDAARRLTQAQMEVGGEGSDAVTVLKEKVAWAYVVERQAVNVQKKFNNSKHASDLESARYFRADAELELLRAEKAAQEKKGK